MITIDDDPAVLKQTGSIRSSIICSCGHSKARHVEAPRGFMCFGARETCQCLTWDAVIDADDARVFMYGVGGEVHPLVAGMLSLKARGKTWVWQPGRGTCEVPSCDKEMKTAVFVGGGSVTELRCEVHGE